MDTKTHQDFKGLTDWVEIFKAGKQTDSKGRTKEFTHAELDQVVANLDPARPPKHVITHSELYSPFGYGDIVELKRDGDSLFARSDNIEPQFDALVKSGRLPDRSVRLMPTENGLRLGHIAWLGAEPPAVEGLAPVEYSSGDEVFEYRMHNDWYTPNVLARFMRRMRDYFIEAFGLDKANELLPEWEVDGVAEHAVEIRKEEEPEGSMFSSSDNGGSAVTTYTQEQLDEARRQAEEAGRKAAESDFSAKDKQKDEELQKERHERRLMEFRHEVDDLVDDGKLTPAMAAGCAEFMASLATGDEAAFDFSAGDGDEKKDFKKEPVQWFRDFMASMPKHDLDKEVEFGEGEEAATSDFSVPNGSVVSEERMELHNKALDYQAKHEGVDYLSAVRAVQKASQA